MKEQEQQSKPKWERWGRRMIYGGIVAGFLGLMAGLPLIAEAGVSLSAGGVIFESKGQKKTQK
jgi:hypothetical protein